MTAIPAFRAILGEDADELGALVADAFAAYRSFAPAGWQPPTAGEQSRVLTILIGEPGFWGELAYGSKLMGHAAFIPAAHSLRASPDPTLAHLLHLFVKPEFWGSGLAAQLLARAIDAARDRGFRAMRLFVATGQARARHFYAREGFTPIGEPFDLGLGLPQLEYQRLIEL